VQIDEHAMRREVETGLSGDVPIVLSQWYDTAKWLLEKIDKFPKNQRFIFGTRLADRSLGILEGLVQASYSRGPEKVALLETANRDLAVLRWLIRMAKDRRSYRPNSTSTAAAECTSVARCWAAGLRTPGSGPVDEAA